MDMETKPMSPDTQHTLRKHAQRLLAEAMALDPRDQQVVVKMDLSDKLLAAANAFGTYTPRSEA